ncbi:Fc.00g001430.m01.CDS01 [Cosmosporella sp. VM-42]
MALIAQSTWNTLGLGVAATWIALGVLGVSQPARAAELFGVPLATKESGHTSNIGIALILGSRDLTIGTALFALGRTGRYEEMGTVILTSMIICVIDVYLVWKTKRHLEMASFAIGSAVWAAIGLGLQGYPRLMGIESMSLHSAGLIIVSHRFNFMCTIINLHRSR